MRRLSGFSLMEMMVVLLITAIVAAASAPMINKKLIQNQAENTSPWTYISGTNNSIAFNLKESKQQAVTIGTAKSTTLKDSNNNSYYPKLNIKSDGFNSPHITLTDDNNNNLSMYTNNGSIILNSKPITAANSVIIGYGSYPKTENSFSNSVAIGFNTRYSLNSIAIGFGAQANADNSIAIGKEVIVNIPNRIQIGDANSTVYIPGNLIVDKNTVLTTSSAHRTYVQAYGDGINDPVGIKIDGTRNLFMIDTPYSSSDRRLKNVGKAFTGGLEEIKKLETYNYTFKKDKTKTPRVGVMAQDLEKIFPNAVFKGEDGFLRIRTEDIFYALVNSIKELDKKLTSDSERITQLEKENKELQKLVNKLEKRLESLEKKNK